MNRNPSEPDVHPVLGEFKPIEDLVYHDCPYVFTFQAADGSVCVAYLVGLAANRSRYLAVPVSATELQQLKSGSRALRSIFIGRAWDIVLDENASIVSARERPIHDVDPADLPPVGLQLG